MNIADNSYYWKKKVIISFVLSILVFWIHTSSLGNYMYNGGLSDTMMAPEWLINVSIILTDVINSLAVPLFFIMAGATFFRDYCNDKYLFKLKKRIYTLLIPYLIWNTLVMIFNLAVERTAFSRYFIGRKLHEINLKNIFGGGYYMQNLTGVFGLYFA